MAGALAEWCEGDREGGGWRWVGRGEAGTREGRLQAAGKMVGHRS